MTIHEQKSGTAYFEKCRKVTAANIRELAGNIGKDERENTIGEKMYNAVMAVLVTCLDGNTARR